MAVIQRHADDAGRWPRWHDAVVMPSLAATVHAIASATRDDQASNRSQRDTTNVDKGAAAQEVLSSRYGITPEEAGAYLARMATQQQNS